MDTYLQDKIINFIKKDNKSGCWLWTGQISNSGYGKVMIKENDNSNHTVSAQLASYRAFNNDIPEGMLPKQICNNRLCVNPQHLELIDISFSSSAYIKVTRAKA